MNFLKTIIIISLLIFAIEPKSLVANEINNLQSRLSFNNKVILCYKILSVFFFIKSLHCFYESSFNNDLDKCDQQFYDIHFMLDGLAVLYTCLRIDQLNKENDQFEKQITSLQTTQ